jgi:predicted acyltransferase
MTYRVFRREYRRLFLKDLVGAFIFWYDWSVQHGELSPRINMDIAALNYNNEPAVKMLQEGLCGK